MQEPQEGEVRRNRRTGENAVFRDGQWWTETAGPQAGQPGQPPINGFVPFESASDRRNDQRLSLAEETAARSARNEARSIEQQGVTLNRQGVQSETDLRKEFLARQPVAEFPVVEKAFRDITATAANASAAGDISLLIAYMKMLDPDSVVRETEFATAQNAASVPDRVRNLYNNVLRGERLNTDQRQDFINQATSLYQGSREAYNATAQRYRGLATSYGFVPDQVAELAAAPPATKPDSYIDDSVPVGTNTEAADGRTPQDLMAAGYEQGADGVFRKNYTADEMEAMGFAYDPQAKAWQKPDGTTPAGPPPAAPPAPQSDTVRAEDQGIGRRADAFIRGAADTLTFGLADEIAAGANTLIPLDRGSVSGFGPQGMRGAFEHNLAAQNATDATDEQQMPLTRMAGQIAGGVAAPGAVAGAKYIAAAPSMVSAAGRGAQVGALAGGAYGAGSAQGGVQERISGAQQGAMTGAMAGGALGGGARVVGNVVQGGSSRLMTSPRGQAVQTLRNNGVSMTPGQQMGGFVGNLEDLAQRAPIVGPAIRGARQRGVESLNRAVGNRALDSIGEGVPANVNPGGEMVGYVQDRLGAQFDRAYGMVPNINVNEPELVAGLTRIGQSKADLPPAMQEQFNNIVSERLARLQGGATGAKVGAIRSELNTLAAGYLKAPDPAQQGLGRMIAELGEELDGAISRASPEAGQVLSQARAGYGDYVRLERASTYANGQVFQPGQLASAVRASDGSVRRGAVGRGEAQMQDLSAAAQEVLPGKFGNPGTADAVGLGGLGVGMVTEPVTTTAIAGGLAAAATPYLAMGRKIVERLPANASRSQLEAAAQELDGLARQDSNVIVLKDEIARRLAQGVPAAAQQSVQAERLMTGARPR